MNFIKVGENTYVGQENITIADFVSNPSESITFKLSVNSISSILDHKNGIKGDWDFNLSLNAVNTKKVQVEKSTEKDQVEIVDEIKNEKSFKETEVYECIEMKEVILDDIIIES